MAPAAFQSRTTPLGVVAWSNEIRIYSQAESGDLREACGDLRLNNAPNPANPFAAINAILGQAAVAQADPAQAAAAQAAAGIQAVLGIVAAQARPDPFSQIVTAFLPRNWRAGKAQAPAALGTAIAPVQSGDGDAIRIYYQMPDMRLGELCKDGRNSDRWFQGEYTTDVNIPGTSIAVVRDESLGNWGYHVFFQGQDQAIYQSTHGMQWKPPRKVVDRAIPCTALSGVSWNGGKEIRLYYQDEDSVVREICCSNNGNWYRGAFSTQADARADFAAVAWDGPHIRVYAQESNFDIVEWASEGSWHKTDFRTPALPNTDITAVIHDLGKQDDRATLLYFVGPDKILRERVQMAVLGNKIWTDVEYVTTTAQTGDFIGQVGGNHFTDLDAGAGDKTIKRVIINSGSWIDSIQFEYTDGNQTARRGGSGGNRQVFELRPTEDIVQVLVRGNFRLQTIQFVTSSGRQSPEYGSTNVGNAMAAGWAGLLGTDAAFAIVAAMATMVQSFDSGAGSRKLWEYRGQPLAGFSGSADDSIRSLQPLWAARPARVGGKVLEDLQNEANGIEHTKGDISSKVDQYNTSIPKMKTDLINAVKADTDAAIQQTIKLGEAVVSLSTASGSAKREIIGTCKGIAKKVNGGFDAVYAIATRKLSEFDNTSTDIVYWESQADSKVDRVGEMLQIAEATSKCTQILREIKQEAVETANRDIQKANDAKQRAEKDMADKKRDRIIRDIFTLGLGEAGDWGGLNSAIESSEQIIRAAEGNLRSANQSLAEAQGTLRITEREIQSFGDLKSRLSGFTGPLRTLKTTLDGQRIEVLEIRTTAFDIKVFMGALTATSAPLDAIRTAADFARGIQKLQDVVQANIKLTGAFVTQSNIMDQALKEILASDAAPTDLV